MTLKETFDKITSKIAEVDKQQADIARKLEGYKEEKARAEAAKKKALEQNDEKAYKEASRAAADADAGIEFNTICLQKLQKEQHATDTEDAEIRRGMQLGLKGIYVDAISQYEAHMKDAASILEAALQKMSAIDSMMESWDKQITRQFNPAQHGFSQSRRLMTSSHLNAVVGSLGKIKFIRSSDPFFKEGGK